MATRTPPDVAKAEYRELPLYSVWTPILAGVLSVLLAVIVILQE